MRKKRRKASRYFTRCLLTINTTVPIFLLLYYTPAVIATAKDLGVAVVAYAPLGRGFLTGKIKSRADLDKNDPRLRYERFSEEVRHPNVMGQLRWC